MCACNYTYNSTFYRKDAHRNKQNACKTTYIHQPLLGAVLTSEEGSGHNEEGIFLVFSECNQPSLLIRLFRVLPVQHNILSICIIYNPSSFWSP